MKCDNCKKRMSFFKRKAQYRNGRIISKNDTSLRGHRVNFCSRNCVLEYCKKNKLGILG